MNINKMNGIELICIVFVLSLVSSFSYSAGTDSYAVGTGSFAPGTSSVAVGVNSNCGNVSSVDSTCVGANTGASSGGTAIGGETTAGINGTAVGSNSSAGTGGTVLGSGSTVYSNAIGIGNGNTVSTGNMAFGNGLNVQGITGAVVFETIAGYTTTFRSNEFNVGGRTIGGVATATQNDQAVNLGQMNTAISTAVSAIPSGGGGTTIINNGVNQSYVDTSSANTLNTAKAYTDSQIQNMPKQSNDYTNQKFEESKQYAYAAAALGMASSSIIFDPRYKQQIAIATSSVNGNSALALGIAWRTNDRAMFNMKAGLAGKGMSGISAGMTIGF